MMGFDSFSGEVYKLAFGEDQNYKDKDNLVSLSSNLCSKGMYWSYAEKGHCCFCFVVVVVFV